MGYKQIINSLAVRIVNRYEGVCLSVQLRLQESMKSVGGSSPSKRLSKMFTFRVDDEDVASAKREPVPDPDEESE